MSHIEEHVLLSLSEFNESGQEQSCRVGEALICAHTIWDFAHTHGMLTSSDSMRLLRSKEEAVVRFGCTSIQKIKRGEGSKG
jgi:hypothetical protein